MNDVLFILAWTCYFSAANPGMKLLEGQLDGRHLPNYFLQNKGREYVDQMSYVLLVCAVGLFVWGFVHLKWYMLIVDALAGILVSIEVVDRFVRPVIFLYIGWIPPVVVTIYLWVGRANGL